MSKIRSLINFEPIKDVIDIDAISDNKEMVENYVITPSLEEHIVHVLNDLKKSTHKAPQIVGGYGSGKSHMLAFIISILQKPELISHIQNNNVQEAAYQLQRDFVVIHWELQPNDVEFSSYFYDRVELQLEEKYGIQYKIPTSGVMDHKKEIFKILDLLKQDDPSRGLVVVVDEISDFLKQKTKEKITRDVQFLRVLGQVSQESDFIFIGAMQEHVFTNPKYVDEAESFGRVAERFNVITIKREDIKEVISRRILSKSREQRLELENLFQEYTTFFPTLQANLEEYIDLFPLHPYVIQVFSELPYFEKRGVIQFTVQEVQKILDQDFPYMITYDRIFDEIVSRHTVKNLEEVSPVVEAIQTLDSKIDLLEKRHQQTASRIVKALGVLKLYGKSANNGATLEELANTLLILPANKLMEARDELALVLKNLRRVTDGQFINKTDDGYYYLDLALDIDYDQVIERRAENLPEGALDEEILSILKDQLLLEQADGNGLFFDTCRWPSRRSFRDGTFVYARKNDTKKETSGEYLIVFLSPFVAKSPYPSGPGTLILYGSLEKTAVAELKKTVAAKHLMNENFHRSIMQKKYTTLKKKIVEMLVGAYLETGQVETENETKSVKSLISREFSNFDELLSEIKPALLDEYFTSKYPQHPRFAQAITRDNIKGELSGALKDLISKEGRQALFSNSKSILGAFNLLDQEGNISTTNSKAAARIRQLARENQGKNVDVKEVEKEFAATPYGYDPLMTAFIFIVLTYNGEISLKAAGGKTITSSEVPEVFNSGIEAFSSIRYFTMESDFDIQPVVELFHALGLSPDKLRTTVKRGEAVQQFRTRYLEIEEQLDFINKRLAKLSLYQEPFLDVDGLKKQHEHLQTLPLDDFGKVKTPTDFKKVVYNPARIKEIGEAYRLLQKLARFYNIYQNHLEKELEYVSEMKKILEEHQAVFDSSEIMSYLSDAFAVLKDASRLLKEEELNPLQGKLEQAHKKYIAAYYKAHEKHVGNKVDWNRLEELSGSKEYHNLKTLKNVSLLNTQPFIKIESDISRIKSLRCTTFNADFLDDKVLCPYCSFPQGYVVLDIDQKTKELEERLDAAFQSWEATILHELQNYRDNIQYLTPSEQQLVQEVIKSGGLTEITENLVIALNNLFKELEIIELTPEQIAEDLFSESEIMDYKNFVQKIEELKQGLASGKDPDKIRIMLSGREEQSEGEQ